LLLVNLIDSIIITLIFIYLILMICECKNKVFWQWALYDNRDILKRGSNVVKMVYEKHEKFIIISIQRHLIKEV
jgi:hypothetical protein